MSKELNDLCTRRDALKKLIPVWLGDPTVLEQALKDTEKKIEEV